MKRLLFLCSSLALLVATGCSEYTTVPQYVSVEKLNQLDSGMDKSGVAKALGSSPYDAYHSTNSGFELYSYKYLHKKQEVSPSRKFDEVSLRGNKAVYEDVNDVYLYFEGGKLTNIITADSDHDREFVADLDRACLGPIQGCTDSEALNYDEKAEEDDDSCEYCPCGFYMNPDYDEKRECGEQCLPMEEEEDEKDQDEEECNLCDLVQNANSNVTLNVTAGGLASTNAIQKTEKSSGSRSALGLPVSSSKSKEVAQPLSAGRKSKSASDVSRSRNKKLEKLEAQLAKSQEFDAKRGKESRQTKLLKKAIAKIKSRG